MGTDTTKLEAPPYPSYSTFSNFINGLKETGVPSRIDKSVLRNLSGSSQAALLAALKWMKLIDEVGIPSVQLEQLVSANDADHQKIMATLLKASYPFLFGEGINLAKATGAQVEQKFREFGIQGSTVIKSIAFFIAAAKDAKIELGPHVKAPKQPVSGSAKRATKKTQAVQKRGYEEQKEEEAEEVADELGEKPGFIKIIIPLHSLEDGALYLPAGMTPRQRAYALKITKFLLDNYWLDDDTQDAIDELDKDEK